MPSKQYYGYFTYRNTHSRRQKKRQGIDFEVDEPPCPKRTFDQRREEDNDYLNRSFWTKVMGWPIRAQLSEALQGSGLTRVETSYVDGPGSTRWLVIKRSNYKGPIPSKLKRDDFRLWVKSLFVPASVGRKSEHISERVHIQFKRATDLEMLRMSDKLDIGYRYRVVEPLKVVDGAVYVRIDKLMLETEPGKWTEIDMTTSVGKSAPWLC